MACQVGPFHLKLTQIKVEMNCIAKHKCTDESQKLGTKRRGENLNATLHVPRVSTTYSFAFYVFAFIFYVIQERFHSETKSYSVEYWCYYLERDRIGDSHQDLIRFNNNKRTK